jgi:hypothetical protein
LESNTGWLDDGQAAGYQNQNDLRNERSLAQSRLDGWFQTHGIANYDFAIFKNTSITESKSIEFRAEMFNLFNRVQFGRPDAVANASPNAQFGFVRAQANQPRLIQLALRFRF